MPFIEAPTTFYLGRQLDPETRQILDEVVYYESRDLTTHAVVVGMTGSGKTGLCITLLEEAILDGVPAIIIDPKGDITNLLLTFPGLTPQEFLPWINLDDAYRAGLEPQDYAQDVANRWREGLASWGIGPQRVAALKNAAEFTIYTPGSDAGASISILDAMQAPREGWAGNEEFHRERIKGVTTALLALIGMNANPVKDREHVLISNIFEYAWQNGIDLTLHDVIVQVQQPPFDRLGVLDIDAFFPEKKRFELALELNNIIASPSFQTWLRGDPLDMRHLLYTPEGKPRVSVFYIAHLNDAQRSFIITLLLESMLASMRGMRGTSSLRALLYFDEVFGHFPPYPKNPPTKEPLLRLLKQARAFGIGLVLATQNPGDLDYKGLSNAGTWFIGRLQTENDKKKVLDGLITANNTATSLNMDDLDRMISSVEPRVFVMNNVHDRGGPILLHTRWAMSYLSGPMTRQQVNQLMQLQWSYQQQQRQSGTAGWGQPQFNQQPQQGAWGQPQFAQAQQAPQFVPPPPPQFAPPASPSVYNPPSQPTTGYTPPPAPPAPPPLTSSGFRSAPPAPFAATPPPMTLPEVPSGGFNAPPPPPTSLPETIGGGYNPAAYNPPAAPFQQTPAPQAAPNAPYDPRHYASSAPNPYAQPPSTLSGGAAAQAVNPYARQSTPQENQPQGNPFGDTYGQPSHVGYNPYQPPAAAPTPAQQQRPMADPIGGTGGYTPPSARQDTAGTSSRGATPIGTPQPESLLPEGYSFTRPALPSTIDQYFLPTIVNERQIIARWERKYGLRATNVQQVTVVYTPFLLAQMQIRFLDRKTNINMVETFAFHIYDLARAGIIHWDQYRARGVDTRAISHEPLMADVAYGDLLGGLGDSKRITALKKDIIDYVYQTGGMVVPYNATLNIYGLPGMGYEDFQMQVNAAAREARDAEIDKITTKFEKEFDRLEEAYRKEQRDLKSDKLQHRDLGREELFTAGEAALSLLRGHTAYTLSRVSRTRRYKGQAEEQIRESEENLTHLERDMDELQMRFEAELQQINQKWNQIARQTEEYRLNPLKKDIYHELFGVGWMPEYFLVINNQQSLMAAWEAPNSRSGATPAQTEPSPRGAAPQGGQGGYADEAYTQPSQGRGGRSYTDDGYAAPNDRNAPYDDGQYYEQDDLNY